MNTQEKTLPRWNLSAIYPSTDSPLYRADVAEIDRLQQELTAFFDSPLLHDDFPQWLMQFVEKSNRMNALFVSLHAYAYARYSVDTTNSQLINNLSMIEEKYIAIEQVELTFCTTFARVLQQTPDMLTKVYTRFPQLSQYDYLFKENVLFSKHQMSNELESLASTLGLTGGESWSRLQEQIISSLRDKETGKTFNELRNEAYSESRAVRETAFNKELELLTASEIPLGACLNSIKGATIALNAKRGWQNALQKSCAQSRLSKKTLDSLIGAIEESLPLWERYLRAKAKILFPNQKSPCLAFYDLFAPLPKTDATLRAASSMTASASGASNAAGAPHDNATQSLVSKTWTFSEAKEYVVARFASFSGEMGAFAQKAFDEHWVDAPVVAGKVGGAYCEDFPAHGQSRVLTNFTGAFSDITTLAHELGHAYHFSCVKDLDFSLTQYPMTLAETASNFAETIVQKDIIAHASEFERISMIEMHLQDSCQVLVDILSRFYFEQSVFERREKGELSAKDFCALMTDAQNRTYGDAVLPKHPYMWALKSHYYSPDLDFYNFPYAFGMLFGSGLYARYQKEGSAFAAVYASLLRDTGRLSCEEVCKNAGFDIESRDFWKSGIALLKEEITELEEFARAVQTFSKKGGSLNE